MSDSIRRWPSLVANNPSDLISDFMALTETDNTPDLFRRWCAISMVAGGLERRVWTIASSRGGQPQYTFPNLYTMLVAPPGVGKYIIEDIRELWSSAMEPGTSKSAFCVAPNNMTKASMIDRLAKSTRTRLLASGPPVEYNSLLIAAEEFGIFLPSYDQEFIGVLNGLYNNPPLYSEERRHGPVREVSISFPQLNILGGAQPGWLASIFPDLAWQMGLASRIIMVFAAEGPKADLFVQSTDNSSSRQQIIKRLGTLSQLYGEVEWAPEAITKISAWHKADGPPAPQHSRLADYNRRRTLHVIKLSLISAVSRPGRLAKIELIDVERAIEWLLEVEKYLPDIFRAMKGKSDAQVIEELYNYILGIYKQTGEKPVNQSKLYLFLSQSVPSEKIKGLLEIAERSNVIVRVAGTENYRPSPRHEFKVE